MVVSWKGVGECIQRLLEVETRASRILDKHSANWHPTAHFLSLPVAAVLTQHHHGNKASNHTLGIAILGIQIDNINRDCLYINSKVMDSSQLL